MSNCKSICTLFNRRDRKSQTNECWLIVRREKDDQMEAELMMVAGGQRERKKLQLSKLSAVTVAIWSWCAITFHHHDPHAHKVLISWWKKLWVRDGITSLHAMSDTNEVINRIISRLETSATKDGESSPHVTRLSALVHFAYCCLVTGCCSCSTTN